MPSQPCWLCFCCRSTWGIGELPVDALTLISCASWLQQRRARGRTRAGSQHPRRPLDTVPTGLEAQLQPAHTPVFLLLSFFLSTTSSFTEMPCFNC